jgi:predicted HicB family RNase H-like nuclease
MDLTPYLDTLRHDLAASAAAGGPEVGRAAELLAGSFDASARLCLMEALSDAAAEVTTKLTTASVEVRLRGREADLVVTELTHDPGEPAPAEPTATAEGSGDVARITLRLPEGLKEQVERAATGEGISVNAWLVRAIGTAVSGRPTANPTSPFPPGRARLGKRITGYAQA